MTMMVVSAQSSNLLIDIVNAEADVLVDSLDTTTRYNMEIGSDKTSED